MKIRKYIVCGMIAIAACNTGIPSFGLESPDSIQSTLANTAAKPQPMDSFHYSVTYEIIFNASGGHFIPMTGKLTLTTADDGTLDSDMPIPVREGYDFEGWYMLPYGESGKITNKTIFSKDTTVYAHWSESVEQSPIISASSESESESEPSKESSEDISSNAEPEDYTITFDGNGGMPEQQTLITSNGQLIVLPNVARAGYRFVGWSTQADSSQIISTDIVFSEDTTVYAQWQQIMYNDCYGDLACPIRQFIDLDPKQWYHDGVHYMIQNQYMIGINSYLFKPNAALTRGMIVQILYNQAGSPEVTGSTPFWDVHGDEWYSKALIWAYNSGIATGYDDGRFAASDPVTREQLAQMLYTNIDQPSIEGYLNYPDSEFISEWALQAMIWANQNHILDGKTENGNILLDPTGKATRAESAVTLMKYKLISEQQ